MVLSPYVFKSKAIRALKGNWQTALLVSFFASLPLTVAQLFQATQLPGLDVLADPDTARAAIAAIPSQTWALLGLITGLATLLTPALTLGCNLYFIRRLHGQEPGFAGLFTRMGSFGKSLLLFGLMYLKTLLWSLLLVVPGVMAALRYALAPFYLAEHPEMGVLEAMEKSKTAMRESKMSLLMLELSFVVWLLTAMLAEMLLSGMSPILALVASQFIQLAMAAYLNASVAGFYLAAASPAGMVHAQAEAAQWLRAMGAGGLSGANRRGFGSDDNDADAPAEGDENTPDGDAQASGEATPPEDGATHPDR